MVHDFIHRSLRDALSDSSQNKKLVKSGWADSSRPQSYVHDTYSSAAVAEPAMSMDYPLGQAKALLHERYIMAENKQGLVLVDARQAQQKILFQKLSQSYETDGIQSRPLLIPKSISIGAQQADMVEQSQSILKQLGFDLSCNGPESVMLRMIPVSVAGADVELLVAGLLAKDLNSVDCLDLLQLIAKLASETQALQGSADELNRLLREIESLKDTSLWRCFSESEVQALINLQPTSAST